MAKVKKDKKPKIKEVKSSESSLGLNIAIITVLIIGLTLMIAMYVASYLSIKQSDKELEDLVAQYNTDLEDVEFEDESTISNLQRTIRLNNNVQSSVSRDASESSSSDSQSFQKITVENYSSAGVKTELEKELLEEAGLSKDSDVYLTDSGLSIAGGETYAVESFKTLADAEKSLGGYLGLHNKLESNDKYELVSAYSVGGGMWYQFIYMDDTGEYPSLTIKLAIEDNDKLVANYNALLSDGDGSKALYVKTEESIGVDGLQLSKKADVDGFDWYMCKWDTKVNGQNYTYIISTEGPLAIDKLSGIINELRGNIDLINSD